MATRKVSIWIRYKQGGGWNMKKAQWADNRRHLAPGMAKGARATIEEFYYLRYQRDGKRITEPAGRDSIAAVALATTREIDLFAAERRRQAPDAPVMPVSSRDTFADVGAPYPSDLMEPQGKDGRGHLRKSFGHRRGAFATRDEIAAAFQPGDHLSTFGGNPVCCAMALANIRAIEDENLCEQGARERRVRAQHTETDANERSAASRRTRFGTDDRRRAGEWR